MTLVIATKNAIYADRRVICGDAVSGSVGKIIALDDGTFMALAGDLSCQGLVDRSQPRGGLEAIPEGCSAVHVGPEGVYELAGPGTWFTFEARWHVMGSAHLPARALLMAGVSVDEVFRVLSALMPLDVSAEYDVRTI